MADGRKFFHLHKPKNPDYLPFPLYVIGQTLIIEKGLTRFLGIPSNPLDLEGWKAPFLSLSGELSPTQGSSAVTFAYHAMECLLHMRQICLCLARPFLFPTSSKFGMERTYSKLRDSFLNVLNIFNNYFLLLKIRKSILNICLSIISQLPKNKNKKQNKNSFLT